MGTTLFILACVIGGGGLGAFAVAYFQDTGVEKVAKPFVIAEGIAMALLIASNFFSPQ